MLSKIYATLIDAGASEDRSREASEEMGQIDRRLTRIEIITSLSLVMNVAILVKLYVG